MKVAFLPKVQDYLDNLVPLLYKKGYFGFEEFAVRYVDDLIDDIIANLPTRPYKPATEYFDRYGKGMSYATFSKNKRTSWYVFFVTQQIENEKIYLVRYVANNHTVAQYL